MPFTNPTVPVNFILGALLFTLLYFIFLKIVLYAIYKLEGKWVVNQRWELIRIFIVFNLRKLIAIPIETFYYICP